MAQKTNPIALRRAAGLRRADAAWVARWGYTNLALAALQMDRWSGAWARHLDRAGVRSALVALPRRRQRLDVAAPADRPRGGRRSPPTGDQRGKGASSASTAFTLWRVALAALSHSPVSPPTASPLAGVLAARLASGATPSRRHPDEGQPLPEAVRRALLQGWLVRVSGRDTRACRVATRLGHLAGVSGGGVLDSHVHATAASHWQSAAYIAGEVARRLSAGASWSRVSAGYLALLARETPVAGLRVRCAGRLAGRSRGAARARALHARWGRTALHTLRRPVDYATAVAATGRGTVGVKVWLAYHPRPG